MRTAARFPGVDAAKGHYESFYVKACHPDGGLGVWIRHTIHKKPGAEPSGSVWFVLFDAAAEGPIAAKATFPAAEIATPDEAYLRIDGAEIRPGAVEGSVEAGGVSARWALTFRDQHEPLFHLPSKRMYEWSLPRTKLLSPHPGALYDGRVTVNGREIELSGWPGMVGHNWGAEHAERWIWLHGAGFDDAGDGFIDIGAGRIKIGPVTTPWIANGMLVVDGESYRLGGIGSTYGTHIDETPTGCKFIVPGKKVNVKGEISAPKKDFVGWIYADPDGPEHNTVNCSIADMELKIERPGRRHGRPKVIQGAAYELGMRETDHGIPIQPFPDG
jgi:hypothetical protein